MVTKCNIECFWLQVFDTLIQTQRGQLLGKPVCRVDFIHPCKGLCRRCLSAPLKHIVWPHSWELWQDTTLRICTLVEKPQFIAFRMRTAEGWSWKGAVLYVSLWRKRYQDSAQTRTLFPLQQVGHPIFGWQGELGLEAFELDQSWSFSPEWYPSKCWTILHVEFWRRSWESLYGLPSRQVVKSDGRRNRDPKVVEALSPCFAVVLYSRQGGRHPLGKSRAKMLTKLQAGP